MSLKDLCDLSAKISDDDNVEDERRKKLYEKQNKLKKLEDNYNDKINQSNILTSEFESLHVRASDQKNILKGEGLVLSKINNELIARKKKIGQRREEANEDGEYFNMRRVLLNDIENAEHALVTLEEFWGNYELTSQSSFQAKSQRIQAEIAEYSSKQKQLQNKLNSVNHIIAEARENIQATTETKDKHLSLIRELEYKIRVKRAEIARETQALSTQSNKFVREERDQETSSIRESNQAKDEQLQQLLYEEKESQRRLDETRLASQKSLHDKSCAEMELHDAQKQVHEISLPLQRTQETLRKTEKEAEMLRVEAEELSRETDAQQYRLAAMQTTLAAFDDSASTICANVDKIEEGSRELEAEIDDIQSQLQSPSLESPHPQLAAALARSNERQQALDRLKSSYENALQEVDASKERTKALELSISSYDEGITNHAQQKSIYTEELLKLRKKIELNRDAVIDDLNWRFVPEEVQERISYSEKVLLDFQNTEEKAKETIRDLESQIRLHHERIQQLEKEQSNSHIDIQTKKALAQHRRNRVKLQKERLSDIHRMLCGADAKFRSDFKALEKKLQDLELDLINELNLKGVTEDTAKTKPLPYQVTSDKPKMILSSNRKKTKQKANQSSVFDIDASRELHETGALSTTGKIKSQSRPGAIQSGKKHSPSSVKSRGGTKSSRKKHSENIRMVHSTQNASSTFSWGEDVDENILNVRYQTNDRGDETSEETINNVN